MYNETNERRTAMNYKEKSKKSFDKQAPEYDSNIQGQHARNLYKSSIEILSKEHICTLLDVGCGTGELLKEISNLGIAQQLSGIDISSKMIDIAKEKLKETATLLLGDSEELPFNDQSFDAVVCNDSFHHYPTPSKVIKEFARVLKKDGILIIGDCWQPIGARQVMNFYMKHSDEGDVKIYSKSEMLSLLSTDFHKIEWEYINLTSSLTIARKHA